MARKKAKFCKDDDFVIQSLRRRGKVISASYCKHALAAELATIGIPGTWKDKKEDKPQGYINEQKARNITFHSLRHTFVTLGRLAGLTEPEIQALAGHTDGRSFSANRMTDHYTHAKQAIDFIAAKEKLEAKFDGKTG